MRYTEETKQKSFDAIIERIERGEALRKILKDSHMPGNQTFYQWIEEREDMQKRYVRACDLRADALFEEILTIADDGTNDFMSIYKGCETYNVENKEVVNRSRLRIDARKWMLSKLAPKKYGDQLDVTSAGERIGSSAIQIEIVRPHTDE